MEAYYIFTKSRSILYPNFKYQYCIRWNRLYQAPRGTTDILPEEQAYWRYIEQKAAYICQLYGYKRIDTPAFEDTSLFSRSVGEETDIVQKEMYTFDDRGGNQITLRPEGTAPVCRAYLEHGMHNNPQPVKLFYLTSIFRYERPQAGRYRQHHQFGCEAIGSNDPAIDAEVIDMAWQLLCSLGLNQLILKVNSIGCKKCRPGYLDILRGYYAEYTKDLCPDCSNRIERNTLRLLDCKKGPCQQMSNNAPKSIDHLCPECKEHFEQLLSFIGVLEIPLVTDHRLVRGLDYYTRTVFEIQPLEEGGQSTIVGGGRYDDLIEELGGKPTPAIGFATGIERIIINLTKQKVEIPPLTEPMVFIAHLGYDAKKEATRLSASLKKENIGVIQSSGSKSLKAQLKQADKLDVKYTVIIGEEEVKNNSVILKDMKTSEQETASLADLPQMLRLRNM